MTEAPKTRRRCPPFGIGELAIIAAMLVPIWWFAATRLVSVEWIDSEPDRQYVRQEWRQPRPLQIVDRGLRWSITLVVSWLVLRGRFQANSAPIEEVKPGPVPIILMVLFVVFAIWFIGIMLAAYFTGTDLG
ncbi:MAG TPA: hypothetical protein VGN12_02305 [Pirellulales bacterium]|jgi:hypothetical protein